MSIQRINSSSAVLFATFVSFIMLLSVTGFSSKGAENASPVALDRAKGLNVEPGTLEKTVFIHYADGKKGVAGGKQPSCYKLIGTKWRMLPIDYAVNPAGSGLDGNFTMNSIYASNYEWDSHTGATLFGAGAIDYAADWDDTSAEVDGIVEYSWGNYPEPGVIAVTVMWTGIVPGVKGRQMIDYDVMFDTDFTWGDAAINPVLMDLQNIAAHETGHGLGLGDIYDSACNEVTMYGYSSEGDTAKRTLAQADITGLQKMYGA